MNVNSAGAITVGHNDPLHVSGAHSRYESVVRGIEMMCPVNSSIGTCKDSVC